MVPAFTKASCQLCDHRADFGIALFDRCCDMRVRIPSLALGLLLGLISASLVSSQVWHLVFNVILHRALHTVSKAILVCGRLSLAKAFSQIGLENWHVAPRGTPVTSTAGQNPTFMRLLTSIASPVRLCVAQLSPVTCCDAG